MPLSPESLFRAAFITLLVASTATQMGLSLRHLHHVQARRERVPEEFASSISLEAHQKAADYAASKSRLTMLETFVGMMVTLAMTSGGLLQAISRVCASIADVGTYGHGVLLIASTAVLGIIVDLPFSLYRTFGIEARFGFNKSTVAMYFADLAKHAALGAVLGLPLLLVVLVVMDKMGDYWWFWVWLIWTGFNLLVLTVYPTLIAPLFNKFSPLTDDALRARIDRLIVRCGFQAQGVYVMDGSRRSSHGNAYFTGFGANRRIVLFDTLISRLDPAELEAVLAHELGHFAKRHILKRIGMIFAGSLLMLAVLGVLRDAPWFYSALGIESPSTAMALLLFFMIIPTFTFPLQPLVSMYSRKHEYEADAYASVHANPDDLVHALVKLYKDNASTLTPDPLHSAFHDSHPPAAMRIARLRTSPTP